MGKLKGALAGGKGKKKPGKLVSGLMGKLKPVRWGK